MNHMITDDNGSSPASPYHKDKKQTIYHICDNCGIDYELKDVRLSQITGEYYCIKGENSCWHEMVIRHKNQCQEHGYTYTPFK